MMRGLFFGMHPLGALLWIVDLVAALWVIYDVWTEQKKMEATNRFIWVVAALFFGVFTAIAYYFLVKRR